MFAVAAAALAEQVGPEDLAEGSLFPPVHELRRVTARIAEAVVAQARDEGVGRPLADEAIRPSVQRAMWDPAYLPLTPKRAPAEAEQAVLA
jgi:malic enzyme